MPQIMRPQMLPVKIVMVAKASDTSLMDAAIESSRRFSGNQVADTGKHREVEAGERRDCGRHVEIDDAEDRALVGFVGNLEEDAVQIPSQNQHPRVRDKVNMIFKRMLSPH